MRALTPRETDFLPAAFDAPAVPQCHGAIPQPAATGVLDGRNPTVVFCSPSGGLSSSSRTSHQPSSVQLLRPEQVDLECRNQPTGHSVTAQHSAANHCLSPSGTKKRMLGVKFLEFLYGAVVGVLV